MNPNFAKIVAGIGIQPPSDSSSLDLAGSLSLYVDAHIFSKAGNTDHVVGLDGTRVVFAVVSLKRGGGDGQLLGSVKDSVVHEAFERGIVVSSAISSGCLVLWCEWSARYEFHSFLTEYLNSRAISKIIWPILKHDHSRDNAILQDIYKQSRSRFWDSFMSFFSRQQRHWDFSHFRLSQNKQDRNGFKWHIDFGEDSGLMEVMEQSWINFASREVKSKIQMSFGGSYSGTDLVPTYLAQSLDFVSYDSSVETMRLFFNFLKMFVGSTYLAPMDEFPVTEVDASLSPISDQETKSNRSLKV
jgi:hypothetical protein